MKTIKTTLLAAMLTALLCAGTVSARQLRNPAQKATTCGGTCSATHACATGCFCSFTTPFTEFCTTRPAGVAAPGK
jgi:hypothetical protein